MWAPFGGGGRGDQMNLGQKPTFTFLEAISSLVVTFSLTQLPFSPNYYIFVIQSILLIHPTLPPYYWYDCKQSYPLSPIIVKLDKIQKEKIS